MIRRGSLLIIVSGLCTLLAILAVAFLGRARTDIDEADFAQRQAQARIMLSAACCYLLEASLPETHDPVYPGAGRPNAFFPNFGPLNSGAARLIGRFPMHAQQLPPHAVTPRHCFDPYDAFRPYEWRNDPTQYQSIPDPLNPGQLVNANGTVPPVPHPVLAPLVATSVPFPIARTMNLAWFRVWYPGTYSEGLVNYREDGVDPGGKTTAAKSTFIVTCGAGASQGFRNWAEMTVVDRQLFGDDESNFRVITANETRLWFEIHWSTINIYHDPVKPSVAVHPPLFSDATDTAMYSATLFVLPPAGRAVAPSTAGPNQYVFPWDPIRRDLTTTNDLSTTAVGVPPLAAEVGWNRFPQSLESDAYRCHGRIVKIVRLQNPPAGDAW